MAPQTHLPLQHPQQGQPEQPAAGQGDAQPQEQEMQRRAVAGVYRGPLSQQQQQQQQQAATPPASSKAQARQQGPRRAP